LRLGHQQAECDRLRITVGEALVGCIGKEQSSPVLRELLQLGIIRLQLLQHLVAQESAEPSGSDGQFFGLLGRLG
jgi:molybdenum cofactor biosynthesis enzyme MoaA